jgi:hypothetical protein
MRTCLVVGAAACVWDDVTEALEMGDFQGAVGCNAVGVVWPAPLDAHVSQHADLHGKWAAQRAARGLPPHKLVLIVAGGAQSEPKLSPAVTGEAEYRFPGQTSSGSSGLFALKVALVDLGFDRAVLCGVPMHDGSSHILTPGQPWNGARAHQPGWLEALDEINDRARSMSGWTSRLLGRPTPDWIRGATP